MPDTVPSEISSEELDAFWDWMRKTYGWSAAERYATHPQLPFTYRPISADDPYYQYWQAVGKPGFGAGISPIGHALDWSNPYDIDRLESTAARKGYIDRIADFIRGQVYEFTMTPESAQWLADRVDDAIKSYRAGRISIGQLPLFEQLTKSDFPDWETYYTDRRKKYYGALEQWAEDFDAWKAEADQARREYEAALAQWQSQAARRAEQLGAQWTQAQQALDIARSQQRGMAAVGGLAPEQQVRTIPGRAFGVEPEEVYEEALRGLPYTAQRYFGGRLGEVYQEFERAYPGALDAWMEAIQPFTYTRPKTAEATRAYAEKLGRIGGRLPELPMGYESYEEARRAGVPGMPAPAEEQARIAALFGAETVQRRAGEIQAMTPEERRERRERPETPTEEWRERYGAPSFKGLWEQYLREYPFIKKFIVLPRSARGFYPSRSVARAQWFTT